MPRALPCALTVGSVRRPPPPPPAPRCCVTVPKRRSMRRRERESEKGVRERICRRGRVLRKRGELSDC